MDGQENPKKSPLKLVRNFLIVKIHYENPKFSFPHKKI
jgi:hypothetical protein